MGVTLALLPAPGRAQPAPAPAAVPRATLVPAPTLALPGTVDSNSPIVWDLVDGVPTVFAMTSSGGTPHLASGTRLNAFSGREPVTLTPHPGNGVWMEAVVADADGTWYGYYHNENPATSVCGRPDRAIARIGAARSRDQGRTWRDLGIILEAPLASVACGSPNRYVIGGVGDLSVALDETSSFLYVFFSQYHQAIEAQGVAVARFPWAHRDYPWWGITVWDEGAWLSPRFVRAPTTDVNGVRRRGWLEYPAGSPLVRTTQAWHDADGRVNAFWGPSVHWNSSIGQYVMLLNRSKDESYNQDGIYVSFAPRLDDPGLWSAPALLLPGGKWYPQVVGLAEGTGSDKEAGEVARFFMSGRSDYYIRFSR